MSGKIKSGGKMDATPFSKSGPSGKGRPAGVRKNKKRPQYSRYTYQVLKQVHKDLGMSKKAMAVFDNFIGDILEQLATESGKLAKREKKSTLKARDMMTATKLVLPGELAKHACVQGKKAVEKFSETTSDK